MSETDHDPKSDASVLSAPPETSKEKPREKSGQTSLRDLVANAGAAFGLLNDDAPAAVVEASEPAEEAPKKRSRKKPKSESDVIASVEWTEKTSELDFNEEPLRPSSDDPESDSISHFEELARRVAQTVSRNEGAEPLVEAAVHEPSSALEADEAAVSASDDAAADTRESAEDAEMAADSAALPESVPESLAESLAEPVGTAISEETDLVYETKSALEVDEPGVQVSVGEEEQTAFAALEAAPEEEPVAAAPEEIVEDELTPDLPLEFVDVDQVTSIIESLLFSTDKPVSVATIKQIFKGTNIRTKDITKSLEMLASDYASASRGVSLEEVNGGFQLRTKSDNAEFLKRLAKVRPFRLSGPALEVMSIVAYKQPVTKHEIDEIRGVESGHLLRALMERGLVCFNGKSDLPGKPMSYGSTRKFLETFGLRNLRELPTLGEINELLPEGIGEVEEKETLSDITSQMTSEVTSMSYSEGEDELMKINEQLQAVDTTSEFFEQEKVRERERRDRERAQDIREKLVVGETVESKDRRWLDRYDAKLLNPTPAPEEEAPITGQLEALTEESMQNTLDHSESAEPLDDMEANPDWDDESDIEKEV